MEPSPCGVSGCCYICNTSSERNYLRRVGAQPKVVTQSREDRNRAFIFSCVGVIKGYDRIYWEYSGKRDRTQSVIKVGYEQAKKIVEYDKAGLVNLTGEKLAGAERIQGKTIDFMPVSFLDLARSAANTVARVVYRNIREHGSGFMISDSLFLTNNHVISNEGQARRSLVQFDYEWNEFQESIPTTIFALDPDKFFLTAPETKFDFTIVAIGERVRGEKTLADLKEID